MNKIFVDFLPPWVETGLQPAFYDKESGSVLQQTARMYAQVQKLCRLFNKLSKETTDTVNEYISKFDELYSYVHDYFDNLDVQEEINTKLDAMVEDGTLQEIITTYIQSNVTWTFDSVADMKDATNLIDGSYAQTLGYYSPNDGGNGQYIVRTITADDVIDEGSIIALSDNTLVAELVVPNGKINVNQFGAKGDGVTDDSLAISNALKFNGNNSSHVDFVKDSTYLVDGNIYIYSNTTVDLNGCEIKVVDSTPTSDAYNRVQFLNNVESLTTAGYGSIENFNIKNGEFNGNIGGVSIILFHGLNCTFDNIYFKNCFVSTHVFDLLGCKDITIKNCDFVGNLLSVADNNFREVIQPDSATYAGGPYWGDDPSFEFDSIPTDGLLVDSCTFKKNPSDTYYLNAIGTHGSSTYPLNNISIKNNTFYDSQVSSIRLPHANNVTIDGNTFYNIARGRTGDNFAVDITNYDNTSQLHDITITNNNFISTDTTTDQIFVNVSGMASNLSKNVTICDNKYIGTSVSESDYNGSDFIHANHIDGLVLNNNHITKAKTVLFKPSGVINNIVYTNNICDNCLRGLRGGGGITDNTDGNYPSLINSSNNIWTTPIGSVNASGCRIVLGIDDDIDLTTDGFSRLPITVKEGLPIYIENNYARIPSYLKRVRITGFLRVQTSGSGVVQWSRIEMYDRAKQTSIPYSYDHRVTAVSTSKTIPLGEAILDVDDFVWYNSSTSGLEWKEGRVSLNIGVSVTANAKIFAEGTVIIIEAF